MISQLGTHAKHQRTQGFINQNQARVFDLQTQISSGKKSQVYSGISAKASELVSFENRIGKIDQYQDSIAQVQTRMNMMESGLNSIYDNAINIRTSVINGLNNKNADFMALGQQASGLTEQTANILNMRENNTYLFAGGRTNVPPVDTTQFSGAPDPNVSDTGYYQGDDYVLRASIDEEFGVEYGIQASDPALEEYFRGLRIIEQNPFDEGKLREALEILNGALDGINGLISEIGTSGSILAAADKAHSDNKLFLEESVALIEDTNIVEATSLLSEEETILQAAYLVVSRLSRLSLVQFLQ